MRIEFDPTNPDEAAAVRAMLTAMHPQEERRFATWLTDKLENLNDEDMNTHGPVGDEPEELERVEEEVKEMLAVPETDSNGEPHDPRIHSSPPKTNADGTWRAKRGVKAEEIAAVRAEREAIADENSGPIEIKPEDFKAHVGEMTNGAATVDSSGEVVKVSAAPDYRAEGGPIAPGQEIASNEGAPEVFEEPVTAPPAPPAPMVPPAITEIVEQVMASPSFLDVMKAITAAQKDGKIDTAKVKELCAAVGAGESTMGLNGPDNGDKRGAFMALLVSETEGK